MSPYTGLDFWQVLQQLLARFYLFATGKLPLAEWASEEIQVAVLSGVAASSALVGCFLILKRMTMLANALSHTILLGIVGAYLLTMTDSHDHYQALDMTTMLTASVIMGIATAFLTEFFTKSAHLQEDASTGLVFTSLFALGVILLTLLTRNAHIGTEVVMGNVDVLHSDDCKLVFSILLMNVVVIVLFFKEFKIVAFDSQLARSIGISTLFFNYLLMVQVSATCIGAFRAVGVLMVLAFMTGPPLAARFLTDRLKQLLVLSTLIGVAASVIGVALSRHILSLYGIALTTGGVTVSVIVLIFLLAASLAPVRAALAARRQ